MPPEPSFRARVTRAFEPVGARIAITTRAGTERIVTVLAVDFIDFAVGRATAHAEVARTLADVDPGEIEVGRGLCSAA